MPPRNQSYKLRKLPAKLRTELDRRLVEGNFTDYRGLAQWLGENGCEISFEAVHKYGQKLEERLNLLRVATAQAQAIVEAAPNEDRINEAMLRLVQQNLFAVLVELEPRKLGEASIAALARSVTNLGRVMEMQRQFADQMKVRGGKAKQEASADGNSKGGLSAAAEAEIKRALLGIAEQ